MDKEILQLMKQKYKCPQNTALFSLYSDIFLKSDYLPTSLFFVLLYFLGETIKCPMSTSGVKINEKPRRQYDKI